MPTPDVILSMNSNEAKVIAFRALNPDRIFYVEKARVVLPCNHELTLMTGSRDIREG